MEILNTQIKQLTRKIDSLENKEANSEINQAIKLLKKALVVLETPKRVYTGKNKNVALYAKVEKLLFVDGCSVSEIVRRGIAPQNTVYRIKNEYENDYK